MMLRDALTIPEVVSATDFVLRLQSGVEDASGTVGEYVVTTALAEAFDEALGYVEAALGQADAGVGSVSDQGVFIHGSFGSGKSHFMAVLDLLLRGEPAARALPGLQSVVQGRSAALAANLLTVDYHLIGANSLEEALFSGYIQRVAVLHPDAPAPMLHRSDTLLDDAARMRDAMGDGFFDMLNGGAGGSEWGGLDTAWDATAFDRALAAAVGDDERERLASDLVANVMRGYINAGEWLTIDDGLAVMRSHAKRLGYEGVVLFLDELVLWLANHLADREFVATEGSKVAKLVEGRRGQGDVPLVSFVARQRDLADFLGDASAGMAAGGAGGAERLAVGQAFQWWEDRFNKITLAASDLPEITHRRLLTPRNDDARAALAGALATLKSNKATWDALLTGAIGADETMFAKVYPFSPALVDTLVGLSSLLQRERTALKVMAQLLCAGRNELTVSDVIPVGDLYDVMVEGGDQPLTEEMRRHFGNARRLYIDKLRPQLLQMHGLTIEQAEATPRSHPFRNDDRLAKTLLVAAIAPQVEALRTLTASRIAALNHGSVTAFVPGTESIAVLGKVRQWAETVGEIHVGEGADPVITLELAGVDYDSVLERVATEDNESARRSLLKRLVYGDLGIADDAGLFGGNDWPIVWRGSKRSLAVVFGNIRDESTLPDDVLRADGEGWKVIVDYPFDSAGHSPQEDVNRLHQLAADGVVSRTVAWVPTFLTNARQDDLGKLVRLEHLLGGVGDQFDRNAGHLPVDQRPMARTSLENLRRTTREKLLSAIKQAYGVARRDPLDIDVDAYGEVEVFPTLQPGLELQPPVGATLKDALSSLADQMLSSQFPDHPRFEPSTTEVKKTDAAVVYEFVLKAREGDGRVDNVDSAKRNQLRRVANPLEVGQCYENHYVFDSAQFPWRNRFLQAAAEEGLDGDIPVPVLRRRLAPHGLSTDLQNLIIASWALLDDKQFAKHGAGVAITRLDDVRDDLVLRDPELPDSAGYEAARLRAAKLFGVQGGALLTAASVARLASSVRESAANAREACAKLQSQLERHRDTLQLADEAPRLTTARLAAELTARLASESDDLVLVNVLAEAALPAEPETVGTSISSATQVSAALAGATWAVLDSVAGLADDAQAQEKLSALRNAASQEELHLPLVMVLRGAGDACAKFLAERAPIPPPLPPVVPVEPVIPVLPPVDPDFPATTVDDITLEGLDDRVSVVTDQMRAALQANPGKKLHVQWWLE
ncbi:unannotated protein [freshwater metagenome]|uniref:Unannotated protein n=1 Tax=freshwater metagenome TaxID=449393 RepID=A0A6J7ITY3_9ZZZZ